MRGETRVERDQLVQRHLALAHSASYSYRHRRDHEDIYQVALCALVAAASRFDPDRGCTFATYAMPTLHGEIKHYLRDATWGVHVPRGMKELALEVRKATDALTNELGQSPSVSDIATLLEEPRERVLEALEIGQAYQAESLSAAADGDALALADRLATIDGRYRIVEDLASVREGLRRLAPRERTILRLRFFEQLSQREIASRVGVSQMHVSRLLRRALDQVRETAEGVPSRSAA